jgi:branched-chain amino acid transport system substrate-binding protein
LGQYFFRSYPSDAFQGKFGAEYAYNTMGARKVAIVYHISEWGTGIKEVFEKRFQELGGEIVAAEGAPQESRDYRTIMSKVKGLDVDLIYMPAYPDGSLVALKQAQELGIQTKFLGADAWGDPKLQKEVSGRGDFTFTEPATPLTEEFKVKILAKTGGDQVPLGTGQAYDNVKIITEVIKTVGTDPEKMQQAIRQIKYQGVSGQIEFDANGDLTSASYTVKQIKDGQAVEIQ